MVKVSTPMRSGRSRRSLLVKHAEPGHLESSDGTEEEEEEAKTPSVASRGSRRSLATAMQALNCESETSDDHEAEGKTPVRYMCVLLFVYWCY